MLLYLKGIILYSQSHIKQSRSIFSIFHLLKGKRGIQTVHDSRIFGLDLFYGIYPSLDKKLFEKQIEMFVNESYLIKSNRENVYSLTKKGHVWLENYLKHLRLDYYNGLTFNQKAEVFFERLLLSIQTYANIHMKRSEERREGKECRSRWGADHEKKKKGIFMSGEGGDINKYR